ncbi:MAG TPA: hypothetical protein PKJ41_10725 [Bryobacteraceae bacterium]|nr:hypothetical protein [Bryobacteraceae bacterium]HPT26226.1 hypothetical protein [Bryobacteraceae bacterium]
MLTAYLDQNKWIEIARAIFRPEIDPGARLMARQLLQAVEDGRLRIPISDVNIIESHRVGNMEQRQKLAAVFASYSRGWFLASRRTRLQHELDRTVCRLFFPDHTYLDERFDPFARDVFWAFGDYPYLAEATRVSQAVLLRITQSVAPEMLLSSLVGEIDDNVRRNTLGRLTEMSADLIQKMQARRLRLRNEPADMYLRVYSALLLLDDQDHLISALAGRGLSAEHFRSLPADRAAGFVDEVPCWDVERRIAVHVERQWSRDLQQNDIDDVGVLTAAIPYCDVVVTEKLWSHVWGQIRPGCTNYKAVVTARLTDVLQMLE